MKATRTTPRGRRPAASPAARRRGGNSGIENSTHQIATLMNDSRMTATASGSPNVAGLTIQARFNSSSSPLPKKPTAKRPSRRASSCSGLATWGSRES